MRLKLKKLGLAAGRPVAFIHESRAPKLNIHVGDRVEISCKNKKIIAIVDLVKGGLSPKELFLSKAATDYLKIKPGEYVEVSLALEPRSTRYIAKKLKGEPLKKEEIYAIIKDIVDNALTEAEVAYFVSGVYEHGMSIKETIYLTEAMYKTGQVLKWRNPKIIDKHSIGGIAGNRTTPIVIAICAAAGLIFPKTSSRAITSAAGTADVIETIARVGLTAQQLKKVVNKVGACLVWGGSLGMAPADDKLIRVERLLSLDPQSQLLASIMSKKLAVGSKYVLIDIPYGPKAKVSRSEALKLKEKFLKIGRYFKLKIRVVLTDGSQPIGNGIGPVLEMKDVLRVLERNDSPKDLEKKCIMLAGEIFEMVGKAKKGKGKALAKELLDSGAAYKKFNQILEAQGKRQDGLRPAKFKKEIKAPVSGKVKNINNKQINYLGRILGCPLDKSAGIYLHKHKFDKVRKSETVLTIYAESQKKLNQGIRYIAEVKPILIA